MSIEPTDSIRNETALDDRTGEPPLGGFAPLEDVPNDLMTDDASMPPAPVAEATLHGVSDVEPEETFPTASPGVALSDLTEPDEVADDEVDQNPWATTPPSYDPPAVAPEPSYGTSSPADAEEKPTSGSVVFFGDTTPAVPESSWTPMDDVDLIMPIEPSRLGAREPAIGSGDAPLFAGEAENTPAAVESVSHTTVLLGDEVLDEARLATLSKLVATRLTRSLVRSVTQVRSLVDDEWGSHTTLAPPSGSVTVLAGSELEGAISAADSTSAGFDGVSVEVGTPQPVPLGLRIPVCLVTVTQAGTPVVSELGGITVTAVAGRLDVEATFDDRVVGIAADDISGACTWLADAANDRMEDQGRQFQTVAVDSLGAVRIETTRV